MEHCGRFRVLLRRRILRLALAGGSLAGALAVAAPLAQATTAEGPAGAGACAPAPVAWVSVVDDLGIPWLEPAGTTGSADQCASTRTPQAEPFFTPPAGWIVVTDDLGIPWLYPASVSH